MDGQLVLMEKAGDQMNVPAEKAEHFRLLGWKQVAQPVTVPIEVRDPFTTEQRSEITKIIAAELAHSSLKPAEKKAVIEAQKAEGKAKAEIAAEEKKVADAKAKAEKEAADAKAKADKEAAAAQKKPAAEKK